MPIVRQACPHCKEIFGSYQCDTCEEIIVGACYECHNELIHNQIPKLASAKPGLGNEHKIHDQAYHGDQNDWYG